MRLKPAIMRFNPRPSRMYSFPFSTQGDFPVAKGYSCALMLTPYHAKYFAHELTKRCSSDSIEKLASALVDAQVDLNPHQIEAALFAFRSPLSKGALLADEVGLGKTIEAGLVLSQKWAERKRRVLVISPSNLRKQWHQSFKRSSSYLVASWKPSPITLLLDKAMSDRSNAMTSSSVLTSSRAPRQQRSVSCAGTSW